MLNPRTTNSQIQTLWQRLTVRKRKQLWASPQKASFTLSQKPRRPFCWRSTTHCSTTRGITKETNSLKTEKRPTCKTEWRSSLSSQASTLMLPDWAKDQEWILNHIRSTARPWHREIQRSKRECKRLRKKNYIKTLVNVLLHLKSIREEANWD